MKSLKAYKEEQMKDPEFAKAYRDLEPEMNFIRALVDARTGQNLTQKELAERTGIAQTEISKIENGSRNPSIKLLQRLADGMGMVLKVSFEPRKDITAH
ncbi:MAG: helix-turn-helix domain-containing protein [Mitsuokella sp.]|uniref:helix-turn-helix domain-containing protein n=1 Tax=Mitsuokella sp. TaxID=2049034 RepID=UPI003D7DBEE9